MTVGCGHANVLSRKSVPVKVLSVSDDQASRLCFISDGPTGGNTDVAKATLEVRSAQKTVAAAVVVSSLDNSSRQARIHNFTVVNWNAGTVPATFDCGIEKDVVVILITHARKVFKTDNNSTINGDNRRVSETVQVNQVGAVDAPPDRVI